MSERLTVAPDLGTRRRMATTALPPMAKTPTRAVTGPNKCLPLLLEACNSSSAGVLLNSETARGCQCKDEGVVVVLEPHGVLGWLKTFLPYLMISDQPVNSSFASALPCTATFSLNSEVSLNMKPTVRCNEFSHSSLTLAWLTCWPLPGSPENFQTPSPSLVACRCDEGERKNSEEPETVTSLLLTLLMPSLTSKMVKKNLVRATGTVEAPLTN
mmetsp:Transcript_57859/g.134790  ORF Transcript_57859/g.134790 Transcript_57859/m.134790 type:complete len:214 (+) Transcript_57859:210-851(+)